MSGLDALLARGAEAVSAFEASIDRALAAFGVEVVLEPGYTDEERLIVKTRFLSAAMEQIR